MKPPRDARPLLVRLYEKFDGCCYYCTRDVWRPREQHCSSHHELRATADHKIPRSRGGRGENNLVLACHACNSLKGDLTEEEFEAEVLWAIANDVKLPRGRSGSQWTPIAVTNRLFRNRPFAPKDRLSAPGSALGG